MLSNPSYSILVPNTLTYLTVDIATSVVRELKKNYKVALPSARLPKYSLPDNAASKNLLMIVTNLTTVHQARAL